MYTGRTPYAGPERVERKDKALARTLQRFLEPSGGVEREYDQKLVKEGKIPAKADLETFLGNLRESSHVPDPEDAELITRFEMQQYVPDILISNYSMLEYMLFRPREERIFRETKDWLSFSEENRLLLSSTRHTCTGDPRAGRRPSFFGVSSINLESAGTRSSSS
jgi:ATP-dependent helicase YprA (DUF1998 family)